MTLLLQAYDVRKTAFQSEPYDLNLPSLHLNRQIARSGGRQIDGLRRDKRNATAPVSSQAPKGVSALSPRQSLGPWSQRLSVASLGPVSPRLSVGSLGPVSPRQSVRLEPPPRASVAEEQASADAGPQARETPISQRARKPGKESRTC